VKEQGLPLPDAEARARIGNALDVTMAVEAAAGTGKTTVLVERIVNVLTRGLTTVDRIVAVTFTEKAAGELKLRLRAALEARRPTAGPGEAGPLRHALANLEQAHVSTIHTFCADLLRERPVEGRVDPRFTMLTEGQSRRVFGEVFRDWLQAELERPREGVRRALRRTAFSDEDGPAGRLENAAWTLAEWRDFQGPWRRGGFGQHARVDALMRELAQFDELTAKPADTGDALFQSTAAARRTFREATLAERVRPRDDDRLEARLVDLVWGLRNTRTGRKTSPYRKGLPRQDVIDALDRLKGSLDDFKCDADADLAACLRDELAEVVDRYQDAKARLGALDFLDLLVRARDMVRDCPDVRAAFQARFTHLFVDEFQDTDPLQAELILLLSADDPACGDWRHVAPKAGKLFVVGDPKQSIYRFRRADVGIYEDVRAQLARHGAECPTLSTSFRSIPSIQRVVNAAFAPRMQGDRAAVQASYVPLQPVRQDPERQPGVVALAVPRPLGYLQQVRKGAIAKSLPDAVGAFVDWLVKSSGWTVTDRDRPGERVPIDPRHVCLLFRRFDTRVYDAGGSRMEDVTRPYVQALEARGIPHLLVGGKSFHEREEVETMRTALAALEWPDDELSVFGTLRGALFAVGDEALLEYRALARRVHPFRRPEGPVPVHLNPVVDALDLLRELSQRRNVRPVEETIALLLGASRAHAIFALRPSGEQALANVQYVSELARQYEAAGGLSFRGFVDELQEEADASRAAEAPILEEGSDGVRLMTAHKAKGLEFPVVVLADIGAELSRSTASRWVDGAAGKCAVSLAGWSPIDLLDHEAEEVRRDEAEGVRVAYVAATRARDLLVVPAAGDDPLDSSWTSPLNDAIFPAWDRRREARHADWHPRFAADSVFEREGPLPLSNVRPGVHALTSDDGGPFEVTWWDPGALELDRQPNFGLRREELIAKDAPRGVVEAGKEQFYGWRSRHEGAVERGSRPSRRVLTVRARAAQIEAEAPAASVSVESIRGPATAASGSRFGALVHAVLAIVPLDAGPPAVRAIAAQQGRLLGATVPEQEAAAARVVAVLGHQIFERIRAAETRGGVRREVPVSLAVDDGLLVEGVVDLAFEEDGGWVVVDFKTDIDPTESLDAYVRQVQLYAEAIHKATGRATSGVLLRL
jgi:ATP-dependent exoDNAse (exonuclease V) beta subunit